MNGCLTCSGGAAYNAKCASFYSAVVISILTLIFCFYKLAVLGPTEDKSTYVGIVTTIIGVWVPNPKLPEVIPSNSLTERVPLVV